MSSQDIPSEGDVSEDDSGGPHGFNGVGVDYLAGHDVGKLHLSI
jgi:hypothetical protein